MQAEDEALGVAWKASNNRFFCLHPTPDPGVVSCRGHVTAWSRLPGAGGVSGRQVLGIHPADPVAADARKLHLAPRFLAAAGELYTSALRLERVHDLCGRRWTVVHLQALAL